MKTTYEDTVELTLNTSHNSVSETAADSSTFQPPSQRIKYASFAEIIVCIPYESKYQTHFSRRESFPRLLWMTKTYSSIDPWVCKSSEQWKWQEPQVCGQGL